MKKWSVETQILAGFGFALGLFALMGALVYLSSSALVETNRAAQRSRLALTALEAIDSSLSRAQADQRLYILTGKQADLRPRQAAVAEIERRLAELEPLLRDDPESSAQLPELEQRVAERMRLLEWTLAGAQSGGIEEVRKRLTAAPGQREARRVDEIIGGLQAAQIARLERRERSAGVDARRSNILVTLLLLLFAASASLLYTRIRREKHTRQEAREDIARHAGDVHERETRLRTVLDTVVDAIIVIDQRGTIESFNRAAERIFGYDAAEVIGKNVSMLMPSPDRERHDGYLSRYLTEGKPRIIGSGREVVGMRKDGTQFPMDLAVNEMDVGGRRMFTGIVRDITERKRVEEQRDRLIRELESANEELKNFAYVVSHDLKAPLRAIGSLADWLHADYQGRLEPEGEEHLRLLKARAQRMDGLINGILEYSRVGRVKETPAAVDTNKVVSDAIALLGPPAHIRIVAEGTLPAITAEPTRILQVFQNLLSNAIKYMDKPEGTIRIGCRAAGAMW
jgi:PAS domain S-box-containing protein